MPTPVWLLGVPKVEPLSVAVQAVSVDRSPTVNPADREVDPLLPEATQCEILQPGPPAMPNRQRLPVATEWEITHRLPALIACEPELFAAVQWVITLPLPQLIAVSPLSWLLQSSSRHPRPPCNPMLEQPETFKCRNAPPRTLVELAIPSMQLVPAAKPLIDPSRTTSRWAVAGSSIPFPPEPLARDNLKPRRSM